MTLVIPKGHYWVDYRSSRWLILPDVFEPRPNFVNDPLVTPRNIEMYAGRRVLDIGTGCGVRAVIAALAGASYVLATDIVANALLCACFNAKLHRVDIDVRYHDMFDCISDKFDAIVAYLPSFELPITGEADVAENDPDLELHERLITEAKNFLRPGGVLHTTFLDQGRLSWFVELIEQNSYTILNHKVMTYLQEEWHFFDLTPK